MNVYLDQLNKKQKILLNKVLKEEAERIKYESMRDFHRQCALYNMTEHLTNGAKMNTSKYPIHLCSFSNGCYRVKSPSGKQTIYFEDSNIFGPSKIINLKTGDIDMMTYSQGHWFWKFYTAWREAGRPVTGQVLSMPYAEVQFARWAV